MFHHEADENVGNHQFRLMHSRQTARQGQDGLIKNPLALSDSFEILPKYLRTAPLNGSLPIEPPRSLLTRSDR